VVMQDDQLMSRSVADNICFSTRVSSSNTSWVRDDILMLGWTSGSINSVQPSRRDHEGGY